MKSAFQLLSLLFLGVATLPVDAGPLVPTYEETFNTVRPDLRFANGARLGGPSTGVSGKEDDQSYVGQPRSSEQDPNGPVVYSLAPIMPRPTSAFTWVFWYCLDDQGPVADLQMFADAAGAALLFHYSKGFEMRVGCGAEEPRPYMFPVGNSGPLLNWTTSGRWIFAAFSWEQDSNRLTIHQGTREMAVAFMRHLQRQVPAKPSAPRPNLARMPETIGNNYARHDRPLAGRLDNFRVYEGVLTREELERIRLADLENLPPIFE